MGQGLQNPLDFVSIFRFYRRNFARKILKKGKYFKLKKYALSIAIAILL